MAVERLIRISADGSVVIFLYDDRFRMEALGKMGCKRASDVVLNFETQEWEIRYQIPGMQTRTGFVTRQDAINMEIQELDFLLENSPDIIEEFMGRNV